MHDALDNCMSLQPNAVFNLAWLDDAARVDYNPHVLISVPISGDYGRGAGQTDEFHDGRTAFPSVMVLTGLQLFPKMSESVIINYCL